MKLEDIKTLITSGAIIIGVILYLVFADLPGDKEKSEDKTTDTATTTQTTEDTSSEHTITLADAEKLTGNKAKTFEYMSANDGDTFSIKLDGQKQKVRLLMIDTPEMNYDKDAPMPYAEDAKAFTIDVLSHSDKLQILMDKGPATDNYDRLLAYVFVDGVSLQEMLLEQGYAAVRYVNKPNNTLEQQFRAIQADAEKQSVNIWSLDGYFENNRFDESNIKNK